MLKPLSFAVVCVVLLFCLMGLMVYKSSKAGVRQGIDFLFNSCYATEQSFVVNPDDGRIIACGRVGQLPPEELKQFKEQGVIKEKKEVLDNVKEIVYNIS